MSDTPETDKHTLRALDIEGGGHFDAVHVQVSKRLERQRNELLKALEQITKAEDDSPVKVYQKMENIARSAIAKVKGAA